MRSEEPASVLEVVVGPAQGARVALDAGLFEVGRSAPGLGTLGADPELSRRHARIERLGDGRLMVEDLASTNGTFVNGARIVEPTLIGLSDEVRVGGTTLRVTPAAPAGVPAASPTPQPRERRPALRVVAGSAPGTVLVLGEQPTTLGRSGVAAAALGEDPQIADEHARLSVLSNGQVLVEDLGSEHGTRVGGVQIGAPSLIQTGDRIELGGAVLELVEAARAVPADEVRAVGGVMQVPEGLFALIGARAPVTREQVTRVFFLSLGWALAANLFVRTAAIEWFEVPHDLTALEFPGFFFAALFPVLGNSFGFYLSFRRPSDRSFLRYIVPTLAIPLGFIVLNLVIMNHGGFKPVATTIVLTVLPSAISAGLMLKLRGRVARERRNEARGEADRLAA